MITIFCLFIYHQCFVIEVMGVVLRDVIVNRVADYPNDSYGVSMNHGI